MSASPGASPAATPSSGPRAGNPSAISPAGSPGSGARAASPGGTSSTPITADSVNSEVDHVIARLKLTHPHETPQAEMVLREVVASHDKAALRQVLLVLAVQELRRRVQPPEDARGKEGGAASAHAVNPPKQTAEVSTVTPEEWNAPPVDPEPIVVAPPKPVLFDVAIQHSEASPPPILPQRRPCRACVELRASAFAKKESAGVTIDEIATVLYCPAHDARA